MYCVKIWDVRIALGIEPLFELFFFDFLESARVIEWSQRKKRANANHYDE